MNSIVRNTTIELLLQTLKKNRLQTLSNASRTIRKEKEEHATYYSANPVMNPPETDFITGIYLPDMEELELIIYLSEKAHDSDTLTILYLRQRPLAISILQNLKQLG
eukprot:snap_masked-scaffold_55-processed-gene-1.8-mRNA-1 protein AED:1.00 eAED:1.00 QI:0/-1/0/0/-1/1/1/0/106